MNIIEVENLNKSYRNGIQALNNLNLQVKSSEIFTLLGENGAGKSTLIKILTTFLTKDSGNVKILGYDIDKEPMKIRKYIATVSQNISIDTHLTLKENMILQSKLYHIPKKEAEERMFQLMESFSLCDYKDHPVESYSGGIKRRLDIAMNMMSNPKILFLDEPTVGMDIKSRKCMWEMIHTIKLEYGTTIFLTTHYLEEADKLSDKILIMKDGKDIICDNPENLKEIINPNLVEITFENSKIAESSLQIIKTQFKNVFLSKNIIKVDTQLFPINKFLLNNHINFLEIKKTKPSIEDIFLNFTKNERSHTHGYN